MLQNLRIAEYIDPSEIYLLPQRLSYLKEALAQGHLQHSLLVQGQMPVAGTASMSCHNLFKLKKMLFIAPHFLEGARYLFLKKHCHMEVENTRTNNYLK